MQYVVKFIPTGELYGPFNSWDLAATWARDVFTTTDEYKILQLIYPA